MHALGKLLIKHKTLLLSLGFLMLFSVTVSYATPPAQPFTAGQTLDPSCAPGETNCTVDPIGVVAIVKGGTGATDAVTARANLGLSYATGSDISNVVYVAAWGDSLTEGAGGTPYPNQLTNLTGYHVYNGGVGGDTSTQIATRMIADTAKLSWPTVIWAGRNNFSNPTQVKADIASMVAALGSNTNYIVLGIINAVNEPSGSANYNTIVALNSDLASIYGSHYIDIRAYLISQYNPSVPQDVTDHNNDTVPSSMHYDNVHLNTLGYSLVAQRVQQALGSLQGGAVKVLTTSNIQSLFINQSSIDLLAGGFYSIAGKRTMYLPRQDLYQGSLILGDGGQKLSHTTGSEGFYNTFVGLSSGLANTTGSQNTAVGFDAFLNNTTGTNNTVLGALAAAGNTTGFQNVAIGDTSLFLNSTGYQNTAIGSNALHNSTTAYYNSAFGYRSLYSNTTGLGNTGIGMNTSTDNTTGSYNVSLGVGALGHNMTGSYNIAIGMGAGVGAAASSDISNNILIGYNAGAGLLTGSSNNVMLGYQTAYGSSNLSNETLIGYQAGQNLNSNANMNLFVGYLAGQSVTTGSSNIVIGNNISSPTVSSVQTLTIGNLIYGTGIDGTGVNVSTGNVGIGVKTPTSRLHIQSALAASGITDVMTLQFPYVSGSQIPRIKFSNSANVTLGAMDFPLSPNNNSMAISFSTTSNSVLNERLRIDGNGDVGIGVTAPAGILHVAQPTFGPGTIATTATGTTVTGSGTQFTNTFKIGDTITANGETRTISAIASNTSLTTDAWTNTNATANYTLTGGARLLVLGNGYVGIGQATPSFLLHVGSSGSTGAVSRFQNSTGTCDINPTATALSCSSDMNLKKNIALLSDGSSWSFNTNITTANQSVLSKLLALTPVDYNWNSEMDTDAKHTGFIAQDVRQVFPDLVTEDANTHLLSLNYMGLIPYTVQAIKEMDLNVTDIANLDRPNTWRESLITWLGSASNGIKSLVVHDKICINNTCVTEQQLQQVLQQSGQTSSSAPQPSAPIVEEPETQSPEVAAPSVEQPTQSPEVTTPEVETETPAPAEEPAPETTEETSQ